VTGKRGGKKTKTTHKTGAKLFSPRGGRKKNENGERDNGSKLSKERKQDGRVIMASDGRGHCKEREEENNGSKKRLRGWEQTKEGCFRR